MPKGYALVYWIHSRHTDILKVTSIPNKCRKDNAVITLKWKNGFTGTIERRLAKIVRIAKDKAELNQLSVDTVTGNLINTPQKKKNTRNSISRRSDLLCSATRNAKIKITRQKKQTDEKKFNKAVATQVSDNESNSSSDDEDDLNNSATEDNFDIIQNFFSDATYENIQFMKQLVNMMEKIHQKKQLNKTTEEMIMEPDPHALVDQDKANIHSSLGSYLPPMTITAVFHRNQDLGDWKKLTTDILVEIYGKQLAFLSARGRRGAQGIDPNVYRAIYDLVNLRLGWILPSKEFVRHINKICSNRKKYARTKAAANLLFVSSGDPIATEPKYELPEMDEEANNFCSIQISETFSQAQV